MMALDRTPLTPQTGKPIFDEDGEPKCCNPGGHEWAYTGTAYGGDDESHFGEGRCYCIWCGMDGDG
jgi:hypothetical protein